MVYRALMSSNRLYIVTRRHCPYRQRGVRLTDNDTGLRQTYSPVSKPSSAVINWSTIGIQVTLINVIGRFLDVLITEYRTALDRRLKISLRVRGR